ncbi:hypothetical protein AVEN_143901-1 [Araneus ventricosus]|uniref:Uncharacterized protein n=1 Tax=Araneus ventricosus TaxID=182803 RepID=A0A4Y2EN42_ARAVE|nr:hypothetical protein AVEN_143901-1 [Araneus ventricosus]
MAMTIVNINSQNSPRHILCTSDNVCTNRRKLLKTHPVVTGLGNTVGVGVRQLSNPMLRQKPLYKRSDIMPCIIGPRGPPTPMLVFDAFTPINKLFNRLSAEAR